MRKLSILLMFCSINVSAQCPSANCNSQNTFIITSQNQVNNQNFTSPCIINQATNPINLSSNVNFNINSDFISFNNQSSQNLTINKGINLNNKDLYSSGNNKFSEISISSSNIYVKSGIMELTNIISNSTSLFNYVYITPGAIFKYDGINYTSSNIGIIINVQNNGSLTKITILPCSTALPIDIEYFKLTDDILSWKINSNYDQIELQYSNDGKIYNTIFDNRSINTYNVKESGLYRLKISSIGSEPEYSSIIKFKSKENMSYIIYDFNTGQRINEPTDRYIIKYEDGTIKKIFKL